MITYNPDITSVVFDELYFALRQKEQRIYSNEDLLQLPVIPSSHIHYKEWQMRKYSSERLIHYLQEKKQSLKILEVGCGNGWLSHRLSAIPETRVIGTDIHFYELKQAADVFRDKSNLRFVYTDIRSGIFNDKQFDIIVFAASIQYFFPLKEILESSLKLLNKDGEIHIIDSHFYKAAETEQARKRSAEYFEQMGMPEMSNWYYHHRIDSLDNYNYQLLYKPSQGFFSNKQNPFPWIRIKNKTA